MIGTEKHRRIMIIIGVYKILGILEDDCGGGSVKYGLNNIVKPNLADH